MKNNRKGGEKASRKCPRCHNKRLWKDGIRKTKVSSTQRFICRNCGYRFSESSVLSIHQNHSGGCQVCASIMEAKNLSTVKPLKDGLAGATNKQDIYSNYTSNQATIVKMQQKIIEFEKYVKREGYQPRTCFEYLKTIRLLAKRGANLLEPETVKEVIAAQKWKNSRKRCVCHIYNAFARMLDIHWRMPKYKVAEKHSFCPRTETIDQIIAGTGKKISIAIQLIKETGCRSGEADKLKWTQIDFAKRLITIIPLKGSRLRIKRVSENLIKRLNSLPRKSKQVFGDHGYNAMRTNSAHQRKNLARKLNNPEIEKTTFCSVRHWYATKYCHENGGSAIKTQLEMGHRSINSTMQYIDLEKVVYGESTDDEWTHEFANTQEEAGKLVDVGFEYVADVYGKPMFRKKK